MKGATIPPRCQAAFPKLRANGVLDEDRVRQVVALLIEKKPRGYFGTLQELQRLVKLDVNSRSAHVESAVALNDTQQQTVRDGLSRLKAAKWLWVEQNADLIGGMRVRLGDDVFDGGGRAQPGWARNFNPLFKNEKK